MVPKDSGGPLSLAGPQMESGSCSGTAIVTGFGRGTGRGGGGGSGFGTGTVPTTVTDSDWGATIRRWLATASISALTATRTAAGENPSS